MKKTLNLNYLFIFLSFLFCQINFAQSNWEKLFNEKNLKNWEKIGGESTFIIEDTAIIGIVKKNTPTTFLISKKKYSDFIIEFEVFFDTHLNSGVQIRSSIENDKEKGLYGYQIEIDPSTRGYSGGIYEQARRGWLYPLSINNPARTITKFAQWNKYHIEAIGNTINTWINGVHSASLVDDKTDEGVFGLQLHDIPSNPELNGAKIKWRNIRILTSDFKENRWERDLRVPQISYLTNVLTDWEKNNGYRLLWDGKTSQGWYGFSSKEFPKNGWKIEDGVLIASDIGKSTDIITKDKFRNFELELEFKIFEGANGGIKYFVNQSQIDKNGNAVACEYQIVDDNSLEAKSGVKGNRSLGSLYNIIPFESLSVKGAAGRKRFKGLNTWNKARIVSKDGKIEHWLNNEKVVEYDRYSQMFRTLVSFSEFNETTDFGQKQDGHILLQNLDGKIRYRSIKIRELN